MSTPQEAAALVEDTYAALRTADDAEYEARHTLIDLALAYAECTRDLDLAEQRLISLGDSALDLARRRQTLQHCREQMQLLWRTLPTRTGRR